MPHFRKKPITVEARQFLNDSSNCVLLHWINEGQKAIGRSRAIWFKNKLIIPTPEGVHTASPGDWIIRGVSGEHYPCEPDIFDTTYEPFA